MYTYQLCCFVNSFSLAYGYELTKSTLIRHLEHFNTVMKLSFNEIYHVVNQFLF